MGWKNVKDYYRIRHLVQITEEGLCIESGVINDLIVIGLDGTIKKRRDPCFNSDLQRYMEEFDADPAKLRELMQSPDSFEKSVTVYTFRGGDIIEKLCEVPGHPNCTHDGEMMYDNMFSVDRDETLARAKVEAKAEFNHWLRQIVFYRNKLTNAEKQAEQCHADLAKLTCEKKQKETRGQQ